MNRFLRICGVQAQKKDAVSFLIGMMLPWVLLFLLFWHLKSKGHLSDRSYVGLLVNGQKKLIYYFAVGFLEEFVFRGLLFGFLCQKVKRLHLSILLAAFIFALPHSVNANAPVPVLLLFSFGFGILACEMREVTGSIWMSTAFHWIWNYSIVSVFMETRTNPLIYRWITIEILILSLCFYFLMRKRKSAHAA